MMEQCAACRADRLDAEVESVDFIWCEGAIDGVGFEKMLLLPISFLPNGYVFYIGRKL
ncbi:MAG: hypothetical protein ACLT98_02765 [Eggerthellaceae bacterium]